MSLNTLFYDFITINIISSLSASHSLPITVLEISNHTGSVRDAQRLPQPPHPLTRPRLIGSLRDNSTAILTQPSLSLKVTEA